MNSMKVDGVKVTQVSYEEFTEYDFIPPANYYCMDSMQNYTFVHTSSREVAAKILEEIYGHSRYAVKASKIQKTKSKLESGGFSCVGHSTRRGQKR